LPVQLQQSLYRGLTLSAGNCFLLEAMKSKVLTTIYSSFCKTNTKPSPGFISRNVVEFFLACFAALSK